MLTPILQALNFVISTVFNIYITIVLIRLCLQLVKADFYNPVSQFTIKATNPVLIPLRRIIPGLFGIDLAAIVLLILLQVGENGLLWLISGLPIVISFKAVCGFIMWGIGEILDLAAMLYIFAIFILAILSWFPNLGYNPVISLVQQLIAPVLRPCQRLQARIGSGIMDLSPMIAIFGLILLRILVTKPLINVGKSLIFL